MNDSKWKVPDGEGGFIDSRPHNEFDREESEGRRDGKTRLRGRPLDDNGSIEFTTESHHLPTTLSAWIPETDGIRLAVLGKLAEELGEASAIVARCIIQGIDESEPVTGKPNRVALQNELADVLAGISMTCGLFKLDRADIAQRKAAKIQHKLRWHRKIKLNAETKQP